MEIRVASGVTVGESLFLVRLGAYPVDICGHSFCTIVGLLWGGLVDGIESVGGRGVSE